MVVPDEGAARLDPAEEAELRAKVSALIGGDLLRMTVVLDVVLVEARYTEELANRVQDFETMNALRQYELAVDRLRQTVF